MFGSDEDSVEDSLDAVTPGPSTMPVKEPYGEVREELSEIGGGRGVFARQYIKPGSLVLAEIPSMAFSDSNQLDDPEEFQRTMRQICTDPQAMTCCAVLHPRDLNSIDSADIQRMKENWSTEELLNLTSSTGTSRDDVLRVALTLQHNGFASGLYHTLTMINHSCSPNCIKFAPQTSSNYASEIWTVRPVQKGEELTICYCEPNEMHPVAMRDYLDSQHRFHCTCRLCEELELVKWKNVVSKKAKADEAWLDDVAMGMMHTTMYTAIHDSLGNIEKELRFSGVDEAADVLRTGKKIIKLCTTMLGKCGEIYMRAVTPSDKGRDGPANRDLLDRTHLVTRVRTLKVIVQAAALSLEAYGQVKGAKKSVLRGSIVAYVGASLALLGLQGQYLGSDHSDLSTTHSDVEEGLRCALQHFKSSSDPSSGDFSLQGLLEELTEAPYHLAPARLDELMVYSAGEAQRLKRLYNTKLRYSGPSSLTQPGDVWWGGAEAERKKQ